MRIISIFKDENSNIIHLGTTNKFIKWIYLLNVEHVEHKAKFLESFKILHDEFKLSSGITQYWLIIDVTRIILLIVSIMMFTNSMN